MVETVPTGNVTIVPFPDYQQSTAPGGQYIPAVDGSGRPATYLYRTYPPVRRAALEGTIFHETWPGHHLQNATIGEQKARHPITRLVWVAGFGEGWASYTERLADEMGLYSTPRTRLGAYLTLAPLMVADIGMQTRGWTVEQAREYLRRQLPSLADQRIASVVTLLASIPGYVASYVVGSAEIARIRAGQKRRSDSDSTSARSIRRCWRTARFHSRCWRRRSIAGWPPGKRRRRGRARRHRRYAFAARSDATAAEIRPSAVRTFDGS